MLISMNSQTHLQYNLECEEEKQPLEFSATF